MPKIMTPAQLANLAKGRAAAKAKREAAARGEAPKAPLEFIQQAPQAPKGPALDQRMPAPSSANWPSASSSRTD